MQNLTKWDANQNGRLDREEMEAFRKDRIREYREQQKARTQAAIEARKLEETARRTRMVPPALLKQYDANTNGLIDPDEWTAYRKEVDRLTAEKRAARLAALPAATNGVASASAVSTNAP
ncbi:MAG: hypothetical protein KIS67_23210 [Verrucomicrobiae bacterium]|nr:hypothetical protein [Verrucomicrobiae bacterium]